MSTEKGFPQPQICSKRISAFENYVSFSQTWLPAGVNVKIICGNITCAQMHTSPWITGFNLCFGGDRNQRSSRTNREEVTVIMRVCGGWGGWMLPLLLQRDWIPTGALYLKGHRLKYRPSIWMRWGDGRRCCSGIECGAPRAKEGCSTVTSSRSA